MSDGQEQQPCPEGPGMTPLMASHKEAGAMGWLGRDGLNLCAGAGEGTAALAKTARPSASPPRGPEPEVSRAAQPMVVVRCRRRPLVECALVVYLRDPSFEVHWSLPHRYAKVPPRAIGRGCRCAPETGSSREPQQRLLAAVASQNVSPSPRRHAVWLCVGLRSSFRTQFRRTGLPRTKGPQPKTPQAAIFYI